MMALDRSTGPYFGVVLLSKDPLLLWSMEIYINVGKYLLQKVPNGFHDSNAGIILYFA